MPVLKTRFSRVIVDCFPGDNVQDGGARGPTHFENNHGGVTSANSQSDRLFHSRRTKILTEEHLQSGSLMNRRDESSVVIGGFVSDS